MFVVVNFVEDEVCMPLRVVVNDTNCFPNDMLGGQVSVFASLRGRYPPCSEVR